MKSAALCLIAALAAPTLLHAQESIGIRPIVPPFLSGRYAFAIHGGVSNERQDAAYTGWMRFDGAGKVTDCFVMFTWDGLTKQSDVIENPFPANSCDGSYDVLQNFGPSPSGTPKQGTVKLEFTVDGRKYVLQLAMMFADSQSRMFLHLLSHGVEAGPDLFLFYRVTANGEAARQ